jgi:hypothetical protein
VRKSIALLFALVCWSVSAGAALNTPPVGELLVDNSYIVTFQPSAPGAPSLIIPPGLTRARDVLANLPKFGEHGTGQSKEALAAVLGLRGTVVSIFETINAAHMKMDAAEAMRLSQHPAVLRVEQSARVTTAATQLSPGWGLDRLDQTSTVLNQQYVYNSNGAGQTVYVLDSGLDLSNSAVSTEFGGRASIIYDVNGGSGADCFGHGTQVASDIAGRRMGVAKSATLVIAKITSGCTNASDVPTLMLAFNWLAANAPRGTIVNLSYQTGLANGVCVTSTSQGLTQGTISQSLEDSITAAYNAGIIVVVSAGNDGNSGCDTAYYSRARQAQAFVVGATGNGKLSSGQDAKAPFSRTGVNISTFAPGVSVNVLNYNGLAGTNSGTSFAAPYIAGIFAAACQYYAPYCSTSDVGSIYQALRDFGSIGTVVNPDGSALTGATSRFISRAAW